MYKIKSKIMENLDLVHFYLSREESRDMIEFLTKK